MSSLVSRPSVGRKPVGHVQQVQQVQGQVPQGAVGYQQPVGGQQVWQQQGQQGQVYQQQPMQQAAQQVVYQQQPMQQPVQQVVYQQQPIHQQGQQQQVVYQQQQGQQQPVQQQAIRQQPGPQQQQQQYQQQRPQQPAQQHAVQQRLVQQQQAPQQTIYQQQFRQQPVQQSLQPQSVQQLQQPLQQRPVQQQPIQQLQQPIQIQPTQQVQQPIQLQPVQQQQIQLQPVQQQPVQQPIQQQPTQQQPVQQQSIQQQSLGQRISAPSNATSHAVNRQSISSAASVRSTGSITSSHTNPSQTFGSPTSFPASVSQHAAPSFITCSLCPTDISNDSTHLECLACTSAQIPTLFCTQCCVSKSVVTNHHHHMSNFVSVSDVVIFDPEVSVNGWDVRKTAIGITWYHHRGSKIKTFEKPKPPIPVTQPQAFLTDSNLHDGWEEIKDPDGRLFYYHRATKVSKWTRPQGNQLPAGWMECTNPDGRTYYLNTVTQATTWDRPAGSVVNDDQKSSSSAKSAFPERPERSPTDKRQSITSQGQSTAAPQSPISVRSSAILETTEWSSDIERTTVPAHRAVSVPSTLVETTNWSPSDPLHRPIPTRADSQPLPGAWQYDQYGHHGHSHAFSKDALSNLRLPHGSAAATKAVVKTTKTAANATANGVKVAAKKLKNSKNAQRIVAGVGMTAVNAVLMDQFGVKIPVSVGTAAVSAAVGLVDAIDCDHTTTVVDVTDTDVTVSSPQAQMSNQQQGPQAQRPSQQQGPQAQRPNQQQGPQAQMPNQQQGPQAQRPNQQQGPQAQRPSQQQGPQAQRPNQTQFNQQLNQSQPQRPQFQNPGRPQGAQSQNLGQQSGPVQVQRPPGASPHPPKPLLKPQQKAALINAGMKIGSSLLKSAIRSSMSGNSGGDNYDYDDNDNSFDLGDTSDFTNDGGNDFDSNNNFDGGNNFDSNNDFDGGNSFDSNNDFDGGNSFDSNNNFDDVTADYDPQDQGQDQYVDADQQFDNGFGGDGFDTGATDDMNDYGGDDQFVDCDNSPDNVNDGNAYIDNTTDQQVMDTTGYDPTLSAEAGFDVTLDATYDQQSFINLQASLDDDNAVMDGVSSEPDTFIIQNDGSYDTVSSPPIDQSFSQDTISDPNIGNDANSITADNLWTVNLPDTSSAQASQTYPGLTSASLSGPMTDYYGSFGAFGGEIPLYQDLDQDQAQDPTTLVDASGGFQSDGIFQDPTLTSAELENSGSLNQDANMFDSSDPSLDADLLSTDQSLDQSSDTTEDPATEDMNNFGSLTPTNSNTDTLPNQQFQTAAISQLYDGSAYDDPDSADNSAVDAQSMTPTGTGMSAMAPLSPPVMPAMPTPDAMPDPSLLTIC